MFFHVTAVVLLCAAVSALLWRWADVRAERDLWRRLAAQQPQSPNRFDETMVDDLPDPVQRYFRYSIEPGAPLRTVAEISMEGEFSLGDRAAPKFVPMRARQIIAAPRGFVWRVRAGHNVPISGSDAAGFGNSWSRFWLAGILPVARAGGDSDHLRAAFGRYVAEAVFWTPAALLPGIGVRWQPLNEASARVTVTLGNLEQAVDMTVDASGQLTKVVFQRWSDANAAKTYQRQPFGGYLSDYRSFSGFRLPTRIEAGNHFETDDYYPFFKATVTSVSFPDRPT